MTSTPTHRRARTAEAIEGPGGLGGTPTWGQLRKLPERDRSFSSPDLRARLKLAPLPQPGTPGSCEHMLRGASKQSPADLGPSLRGRLCQLLNSSPPERSSAVAEEASWAAATLSSLSPQVPLSAAHSVRDSEPAMPPRSLDWQAAEQASTVTPVPSESEPEKRTVSKSAWRNVDPVDAFSSLDGGPRVEEALARLLSGSEGFPEAELVRMNITFCRHKEADNSEVAKEELPRILSHLGYLFAKPDKVDKLAKKISDFSTFDFSEFEHLTMNYCLFELEELRSIYGSFEKDGTGTGQVAVANMEKMLRAVGIITVRAVVRDVLEMAKLHEQTSMSFTDFLGFLAAYRAVEGFSWAQVAAARKVFDDETQSFSGDPGGNALKAKKSVLANALLKAYGEAVAGQLPELLDGIHWDGLQGSKGTGISFHEFMVWGRKLQDIQLRKLDMLFNEAHKDADGRVSADELVNLLKPAGFTLFSGAMEEVLYEMNASYDSKFDFSDYVRFLKACQKRYGFSRFELEELGSAFRRFDYDRSDGIDHLELLDLLRYLGYSTHLKDVHKFIGQVDFNGNGTMDFGEYLFLMRLHREDVLASTRSVFNESTDEGGGTLPATKLKETLEKLSAAPRPDVLQMLVNSIGNPEHINFEKFVQVMDHFRRLSTTEKRKRAGFSHKEFDLISKLFEKYNTNKKDRLEKGELILLLIDAGIFMNTAEARSEIFTMLDEARETAAKAGIESELLGRPGSPRCTFWPLVHLLRAVFHKDETGAVHREDQAVDETRFEPSEVQEFREIFLECSRWSHDEIPPIESEALAQPATPVATRARRASLPSMSSPSKCLAATVPFSPAQPSQPSCAGSSPMSAERSITSSSTQSLKECLSGNPSGAFATVKGVQVVLFSRRMNMRLFVEQRQELERKVQSITGRQDSKVDFADFLRLMKWMVTTNFSKINEIAEKVVDQERAWRCLEDETKVNPASILPATPSRQSQRRKSL